MTKKIIALTDYITADEAAKILSDRLNRMIPSRYIRKLSQRKKKPVRAIPMGNRVLYYREDIESCSIKQKAGDHLVT
jgi:hypothetical protein